MLSFALPEISFFIFTVLSSTVSVVNIKQIELLTVAQHRFLLLIAKQCDQNAVDSN